VADFESQCAVGLVLEIWHQHSFLGNRLWVLGCSGPGTWNLPPKKDFCWWTWLPIVQRAWHLKSTTENHVLGADFKSYGRVGLGLQVWHWKSFFFVSDFKSHCAVGLGLESCPLKIFFGWHTAGPVAEQAWHSNFNTQNHFFCWTSSPTVQRACDSKSTPENQILVVDITSCNGVGLTLKSDTGNLFFWLDFKSYGQPGLGLEIQHQKSFFSVGLQVQGCSGCGTWNFPQKISFCWWTSSLMVEQACHSSPTPEIIFCGLGLKIWHQKLVFGGGLQVRACSRPGTQNAPLKIIFCWWTSSPRVQLSWNLKSSAKNDFWQWTLSPRLHWAWNSTTPPKMIFFWQTSSPKRW